MMKSIFDKTTRDELIDRIHSLREDSTAQWGKMDINQMLRHCIMWDEVTLGRRRVKRSLMSRFFGKMILKGIVKDDSPLKHNLPAIDELKVKEAISNDITTEKEKWISLINEYPRLGDHNWELPFFGKVEKEHAGCVAYKHSDHHLRQFDA